MKLQHITVIFVIIIIPISLVMTEYIQTQIDTIVLQTAYTTSLNNATYDALKAFQINTVNNKYSSLSTSKIRDIEATINTFYNSLGVSMDKYISSKEELSVFIPVILFNLYDGYYIYSSYNNIYTTTGNGENERVQIEDNNNYQDGLRPYIYYSCEYRLRNGNKVIVNYTLDNAITVYGDFGRGYETKSGYLIDYNKINYSSIRDDLAGRGDKKLIYDGVEIGPEILTEHLITIENVETGEILEKDYPYIVYNNKKVYYDSNAPDRTKPYFWYDNYKKNYLQSETQQLQQYLNNNGVGFKSISAFEYYLEAYTFSKWVVEQSGLSSVTQARIIQNDRTMGATTSEGELYLSIDTRGASIFDTRINNNDPLLSNSVFNQHREAIIRKSIETNLITAIANYNIQSESNFEFVLPIIDEENWYKITNNVSIAAFMQGMPIGHKYYNNYSVITNTKNEEVVNEQSVYIMLENSDGNIEYHQPGCRELIEKQRNNPSLSMTAYNSLSFQRQTVRVSESNIHYFYPQARVNKKTTGCYNCIVNAAADYDIDSIVAGEIRNYRTNEIIYIASQLQAVRKSYFTGLARERYDLYRTSKF